MEGEDQPEAHPPAVAASAQPTASTLPATTRRYGTRAFLVVFLLAAVLFVTTIWSTLAPIVLGGILAAVSQPLHQRLLRHLPGRNVGAALMTVILVLAVLLPIGGLTYLLVHRLATVLGEVAAQGWFTRASRWRDLLGRYPMLRRLIPVNLGAQVTGGLKLVAGSLPGVLAGIADGAVALFLTIIATYYFLRDADWIFLRLERALPLEPRHTRAIADEFQRAGRAVIIGTLGTALLQGVVAGIAYWAIGLPQALLLGALTAIAALVPVVGTALVLVPAALYLLISGEMVRAVLLVGVGLVVVGLVDNVVRPLLNRRGLEIHPLLAFLAIFGGLATFGVSGLYLGPLFVALFLAVVRIYESEVAPTAAAPVAQPAPEPRLARTLAQALSRSLNRRRQG